MHSPLTLPAVLLLAAVSAAPAAEPLATRQTAFDIPYRLDPPRTAAERPVEVQLYVSADRGVAWKLHSHVSPEQGRFTFKAEKDGEYWFLVRTKDSAGNMLPHKPPAPELQVLVDTAQPTLQLSSVRGEAGEVNLRWQANDPNLQPQNLKLDYQAKGAADLWQSIAIDPRRTQVSAGSCSGEVTLWVQATNEPLVVRAEITDRAGNLAVSQSEVEAGKQQNPSALAAAAIGAASGTATQPIYPDTGAPEIRPVVPVTPPPATTQESNPVAEAKPSGSLFPALGWRWPADQTTKPLARAANEPLAGRPVAVQRLPSRLQTPQEQVASNPSTHSSAADADWVQPPLRNIERPAPRAVDNPVAAVSTVRRAAGASYRPPPGVRPRMVNSTTFQLEYDLGANLPGGPRKVELWGTRDGGQRWSSYGADADLQSPLSVTVEGEGMYGFRILVQSGTGMIEFPPQRGDRPDTWVAVDVTRPVCRLLGAQQQRVEQAEQLQISWEAHDEFLAERPISISYSQQPQGPWLPLASGLENTGRYAWSLDSSLPEQVFLRLEARDQAGNIEVYQSPQPVILSRQAPPSRIRDVRPTYEQSQGPRRYRFW